MGKNIWTYQGKGETLEQAIMDATAQANNALEVVEWGDNEHISITTNTIQANDGTFYHIITLLIQTII